MTKSHLFSPDKGYKRGIFIASGHALVDIGKTEQNSDGKAIIP